MHSPPLKLLLATAVCIALSSLAGAAALAAQSGGKPAATAVTIESWPGGLTGKVSSPNSARCAEGRRVIVYRARGSKLDPQVDQRVATTRAKGAGGEFGWTVESGQDGRLYAQAPAKKGCAAALSRVIGAAGATGPGGSAGSSAYPTCGTYISETMSRICRIENLVLRTFASRGEKVCSWSQDKTAANCSTPSVSGPYPWAGEGQGGATGWKPAASGQGRTVTFERFQVNRPGVTATLEGTLPDVNSQRFTVTDAYAPDEGPVEAPGGTPAGGDHFYTPDLPNTLVGEVGGPLKMEVGSSEQGNRFTFNGYLYLKR